MTVEHWRAVADYEGFYEVSDLGRVRSIDRINAQGHWVKGVVLRPDDAISRAGHLRVTLCRNSRTERFFVHRLVLAAFVGEPPDGMQGCHNDGNPANNAVLNLRWDTPSANARDRRRHGTDDRARRTHCPSGHEYVESNTYRTPKGWRACRICVLARQAEKRARIRMQKAA